MAKRASNNTATGKGRALSIADLINVDLPLMKADQLTVFSEIGNGRFKTVSSGCHTKHGSVAVFRYKSGHQNEAEILSVLQKHGVSEHIPETYGFRKDLQGLVLAQELSPFGSVKSVLEDDELRHIVTLEHKLRMAEQFAEAVSFLESACVVHTDLACRNFLFYKLEDDVAKTVVKLTDFNSAIVLPANAGHIVKKLPQATRWCAPETVVSNKWSCKTDVWSLGATLWELFSGGLLPWTDCSKRADVALRLRELAQSPDAHAELRKAFPSPDSSKCPPSAYKAMLSCLQVDAKARPAARHLADVLATVIEVSPRVSNMDKVGWVESTPAFQQQSLGQPLGVPYTQLKAQERMTPERRMATSASAQQPPSGSKLFKSGSFTANLTPPTRCPSTPECASRQTTTESVAPRVLVYRGCENSKENSQSSTVRSTTRLNPQQQGILESIKMLDSCPRGVQNKDALSGIREFLSSPEAVCGLSLDKQLALRQKLAAAEAGQEGISMDQPRSRLLYQDTIIPLVPLGGSRSLCPVW